MSGGQHVGGLSDNLKPDEALEAARSSAAAMRRVMKPSGRTFNRANAHQIGDGDICPVDQEHGRMLTLQGSDRQFCPDQSHDGAWSREGKADPTRNLWPMGQFNAAVKEYARG